jgi:HEAT repeat protein
VTGPTLEELITRLRRGDEAARSAALAALAGLGAEGQDVPALVRALAEALAAAEPDARAWLVAALAPLPGDEATAALAGALGDPDEGVRASAALALGGRRAGLPALLAALDDPSTFVALQAGHALTRFGREAALALSATLQGGSASARVAAARALATIRATEAIPALIAALEDDSPAVQFYAEQALERMGVGTVLLRPD